MLGENTLISFFLRNIIYDGKEKSLKSKSKFQFQGEKILQKLALKIMIHRFDNWK